ncbi:MAG TPA: hypothetical protein VMT34_03925 [Aggregatilineales bacterium]|nr:hypothetical protein [Aggregatilineales bacterium]
MSMLDELNRRFPGEAKYRNLSRAHGPIFAEAAERYLDHTSGRTNDDGTQAAVFLHALASKLLLREEAAVGALVRAQEIDDESEAAHCARRAEKNAQFALIVAFAMKNVAGSFAADPDSLDGAPDIQTFANRVIGSVLSRFESFDSAARLCNTLFAAEHRGWATLSAHAALPILIGANWCPDTANLAEIANILCIPITLMFYDYVQPPEDKGKRKHGIFQIQDHAQALYEDGYERPSIPVVRYPNGVTHIEPPLFQFVEQLAENGFI